LVAAKTRANLPSKSLKQAWARIMPARGSSIVTRISYGARQLPRVAWYVGHSLALRRLSEATRREEGEKAWRRPQTDLPVPDRNQIYADMAALFLQDLANVEAGIYPIPHDHDGSWADVVRRSRLFFDDLPAIHERRKRRATDEVLTEETRGKKPRYYLQNFHFQSGGWLTDDSAERYDTQVEVLFNGTANAIRRQVLPQLREVFASRDQRRLKLIDIGCGTGRCLDSVKQVWPRLPTIGLDMSEAYIRHAKRELKRWGWTRFIVGKGEAIPLPDNSLDAITSVFLLHELPPKIRRLVFKECARVLKPGGRLVLVDSLQPGDRPDYDGMLQLFPQNYHEPYYESYLGEDFSSIAADLGLSHVRSVNAFVSKVMVFDKID
jgi:ubiquinone/menaquinone biosynthesis C-methylase UbiE